jgi:hypothetical protein
MRGRRLEKTGSIFAEYVEDFYGPRTTQMPADHSSQQNGIARAGPSRVVRDRSRRGFSYVRPTEACSQSAEEAERAKPRRPRDRTTEHVFMNSPG